MSAALDELSRIIVFWTPVTLGIVGYLWLNSGEYLYGAVAIFVGAGIAWFRFIYLPRYGKEELDKGRAEGITSEEERHRLLDY